MTSEKAVIVASDGPVTTASLGVDFERLGILRGDLLMVHSSLSALGWVAGGAHGVVQALMEAVGDDGTLVMPTQTGQLSDPADWDNPGVPPEWVETIRAEVPAYDPHLTPTRGMGQVVECFRSHPEVIRSPHPHVSFAALGPLANELMDNHPLTPSLGETSPLARMYDRGAKVLLLGVTHANNTSLHLAEYRASWPGQRQASHGGPMLVDGARQWVSYEDKEHDDSDFGALGEAFAATGAESQGPCGHGLGRLFAQRAAVDFAVAWISANRCWEPRPA